MANTMGRIMVICLMAVISTSSSPLGDSRSINDELKLTNMEAKSPVKRAYTYASEYKRLPIFNFGIGKRLNRDIKGGQLYSFGIGKRSGTENAYPLPYDGYKNNRYENSKYQDNKRGSRIRPYDFGLGKRMAPDFDAVSSEENSDNSQAIRTFLNEDPKHRFIYGTSNRFFDDQEDVQEDE